MFIYAIQHSLNSQPIGYWLKVQTKFPIWHHIAPASPLIPFFQLIPSILIFLVDGKSIRALLATSIGLQLAFVLTLRLFSHSLPLTAIIPTHNTIRPQFMLLINRRWCYNYWELHVDFVTTVYLNCELIALTLSIYTWFSVNTFLIPNNIVFLFYKYSTLLESSPIRGQTDKNLLVRW